MNNSSTFLGISNYAPTRFQSAEEVESVLGDELRSLVGETFDSVWLMWEANEDEWFVDGPVIFGLGGCQLEVCAFRNDTLLVSLDAIDRTKPLDWYGGGDFEDAPFDLRWVENPSFGRLKDILGRKVRRIGVGEYAWELSEPLGFPKWLLVSMEFELEDGYFSIFNAMDENGLNFERRDEGEDWRRTWIAGD